VTFDTFIAIHSGVLADMTPCSYLSIFLGDEDKMFLCNTGNKRVYTVTNKQSAYTKQYTKSKSYMFWLYETAIIRLHISEICACTVWSRWHPVSMCQQARQDQSIHTSL